jgi:ribosome-interacting GTPase 1
MEALEEMLTIMPKHKGTDRLRADLRRRIAKVKDQAQQKKGASKREAEYAIVKEGAVQVVVVGPPNTGKSSLIVALTNASPEVADFPHSTWKPTPGMAAFENIQFQLVDTPPISRDYMDQWIADLMRRADILALLLDLRADPLQQYEETLFLLGELRIFPVGTPIPEDLKKPPFVKITLILLNKMDDEKMKEDYEAFVELAGIELPCLGISTRTGQNMAVFLQRIYGLSGIIRVYTKAPGKQPDRRAPFVLPKDSTLGDLAAKIHKDFVDKLKFAKIWGTAAYDGQMAQKEYVLQDGDVVEMHI